MKIPIYCVIMTMIVINLFGLGNTSMAEEQATIRLEDLQWKHRIILVFGKMVEDEKEALVTGVQHHTEAIDERHLLYFLIGEDLVTNADFFFEEEYVNILREKYAGEEQELTVILIGKDGGEKYRRSYLDLEEIYRIIDAMPMRMREMQQQERRRGIRS